MRSLHTIITTVLLGALLCVPVPGRAAPTDATHTAVILEAQQPSVATTSTGSFSYKVRVRPAADADSISATFELFNADGNGIFLRTTYWNFTGEDIATPDADGRYSYTFTRDLVGLALGEGRYRCRCTVVTSTPQGTSIQTRESTLFVYDASAARCPVALVLRIGAPPLCRTDGDFASDPATGTARQRTEELGQVADLILSDPKLHLTLAPSPLLIEELGKLAAGSRYVNSAGALVALPPSDAAARYAAQVIVRLKSAIATGRLKIAWQGYSDPNVSQLLANGLSDDLPAQYEKGRQALQTVLGVSPIPMSAPFGGRAVVGAREKLRPLGIEQIVPASYNRVSQSLEATDLAEPLDALFALRGKTPVSPVVVGLPEDPTRAAALMLRLIRLTSTPWISFTPIQKVTLRDPTADPGPRKTTLEVPPQDFTAIRRAREAAIGLTGAAPDGTQDALEATQLSLVAENAFGPRPSSGANSTAPESFADGTLRIVGRTFSALKLRLSPVTLAGSTGEVPITIANSGKTAFKVHLEFANKSGGLKIDPTRSPLLTASGNNTLYSANVRLSQTGSSDLRVRLKAGSHTICEDSVAISASYLDTIVIVAIVVIVGVGLLLYLWRHARQVQKGEGSA
ncbi:MAG: DUF6049 family protein [Actinomycetia bacterium]|nr:DUF6049 family protein [Actinomycetes bacterium]